MIDLENAQLVPEWVAVRKRVQSRAEHHDLTDAAFNRRGQSIFRKACPHRDEESQPASGWVTFCFAHEGLGVFAQNGQGERIRKDSSPFQDLMSGAVSGGGSRCSAWLSQLHD
jgi:hypothetical protein